MTSGFRSRLSLAPEIIKYVEPRIDEAIETVTGCVSPAVDTDNFYGRLMTDMKFHLALASISQCQIQLKILQDLFDMLLLKYKRNLILLGIMDSSLQEHAQILKSLEARDAAALQQDLSTHLDHVRTHIIEGFERMFVNKKEAMSDLFTFP